MAKIILSNFLFIEINILTIYRTQYFYFSSKTFNYKVCDQSTAMRDFFVWGWNSLFWTGYQQPTARVLWEAWNDFRGPLYEYEWGTRRRTSVSFSNCWTCRQNRTNNFVRYNRLFSAFKVKIILIFQLAMELVRKIYRFIGKYITKFYFYAIGSWSIVVYLILVLCFQPFTFILCVIAFLIQHAGTTGWSRVTYGYGDVFRRYGNNKYCSS